MQALWCCEALARILTVCCDLFAGARGSLMCQVERFRTCYRSGVEASFETRCGFAKMAVTDGFVVFFLHACTSEFVCIVKWPFFLVRKRLLCSSQCWHTFWFLHLFSYINYALKIWLERSVFIRENLGSNHISKTLFFLSSLFFCQFELVPPPFPDSSMMYFFLHTSVLISRRHFEF